MKKYINISNIIVLACFIGMSVCGYNLYMIETTPNPYYNTKPDDTPYGADTSLLKSDSNKSTFKPTHISPLN